MKKPVKAFLRHKFKEWYATNLISQLEESNLEDIQPIDLELPVLKNCGARWLVEAAWYFDSWNRFVNIALYKIYGITLHYFIYLCSSASKITINTQDLQTLWERAFLSESNDTDNIMSWKNTEYTHVKIPFCTHHQNRNSYGQFYGRLINAR